MKKNITRLFTTLLALTIALSLTACGGKKATEITVAIPNDTTNEARALLLLQEQGLIKLKDGVGITATILDIAENPHNIKFNEVEAAQLPNVLKDVDYAVINANYAIAAGLNPAKNALGLEGSASAYGNILCVKEGNENQPLVKALAAAGVDLYLIETMVDMSEARAAVLAVRETDPHKPVVVSFYCDDEGRTLSGVDVLAGLIVMEGMGVAAFGLNCMELDSVLEQLERLAPYASIPLVAQPASQETDPERLAAWAAACAARGVRLFGGCCGAGPETIAALRKVLDGMDVPAFSPAERDPDVIPCASEREARFITPEVDVSDPVPCTSDLVEDIVEIEEKTPVGAIKIEIMEEDDVYIFAEHQYAVEDALCLWSDVPELLEKALRVYQGRAFWDGTGDIEDEDLEPLVEKYGLIIL